MKVNIGKYKDNRKVDIRIDDYDHRGGRALVFAKLIEAGEHLK